MITQAKANIGAVKNFEHSVMATRDYSSKINKGIQCLGTLIDILQDTVKTLNNSISKSTQSCGNLSVKIVRFEHRIANLSVRIEQLERKLENLEIKLEHTQENDDYVGEEIVSSKIDMTENEISEIRKELSLLEERLDYANTTYSRLELHIDAMNGVTYSLEEKENTCRRLKEDLETIQQKNLRKGSSASETLHKLQAIIEQYLRIKMEYEEISHNYIHGNDGNSSNKNINIDIHKSNVIQINAAKREINMIHEDISSDEKKTMDTLLTEQKKEEQNISFDNFERIKIYDGKTFGGKYNSYDNRLKHTSVEDNPMLGHYEGERGESKFIPSNRTAEGIVIAEILEQYGLDGITYINAEPDFEACSEAVVKITWMTENRENYYNEDGILIMGNFSQADIKLAEEWNRIEKDGRNDWIPRDVLEYRKEKKLTWHEKCDTETMVLVRFEINLYFKHCGGCSECRIRDAVTDDGGGFDE